jgi:hypothetical protein
MSPRAKGSIYHAVGAALLVALLAVSVFRLVETRKVSDGVPQKVRAAGFPALSAYTYLVSVDLTRHPYEALVADFLGRRFGVPELRRWTDGALAAILTQSSPQALYARLVLSWDELPQAVREIALPPPEELGPILYFPLRSLQCDLRPLPDNYPEQLAEWSERGGYVATHTALAMLWAFDQGCLDPSKEQDLERLHATKLLEIVRSEAFPGDLYAEALAVLAYMRGPSSLDSSLFDRLAESAQPLPGGGFRESTDTAGPSVHTSVLALWAFLELANPELGRGGWIPESKLEPFRLKGASDGGIPDSDAEFSGLLAGGSGRSDPRSLPAHLGRLGRDR